MIMRALIIRKFEKARELRKSVIHREGGRDRFADIEFRPGSELKIMPPHDDFFINKILYVNYLCNENFLTNDNDDEWSATW